MYKELLAGEGIDCLVRNDRLTAALGEIPFVECFPELWVVDEEVYPRAKKLLDAWLSRGHSCETWHCPGCGEQIEGQFSVCWACGSDRN